MRNWIFALLFLLGNYASAIPVVNENVANSGVMTIYPDSQDSHRFYIAPNVVMIATSAEGIPYFSYNEYRRFFNTIGIMQMTLVPAYTRDELEIAKVEILKKDPEAQFSGVPFVNSSLELTGNLPELIDSHQCNHIAGLIGQEQSCTISLTSRGRALFHRALERKTIFTTLQFEYAIQAVVRKADGSFADQMIRHGVAVRIDGDQLSKFPKLLRFDE